MYIYEQQNGQWGDLLQKIRENTNSDNIKFKTSSILTLGYICEDIVSSRPTKT